MSLDVQVIVITVLSMLLYSYDVTSDIVLAVAYSKEDNHTLEYVLTTGYIVVPNVLCNAICAYYIYLESSSLSASVVFQMIFTFPFLLGLLVRYVPIFSMNGKVITGKHIKIAVLVVHKPPMQLINPGHGTK